MKTLTREETVRKFAAKRLSVNVPPCSIPNNRRQDVLTGVYHPTRLKVLGKCQVAQGIVTLVRHESDKDWHIDLKVDSQYTKLLCRNQKYLVTEIIPLDQPNVKTPTVGQYITVYGVWCFDTVHGWNEIHSVWKIIVGTPSAEAKAWVKARSVRRAKLRARRIEKLAIATGTGTASVTFPITETDIQGTVTGRTNVTISTPQTQIA
jgi:hypothetical protein